MDRVKIPILNFKEVQLLAEKIQNQLTHAKVEKIYIPKRDVLISNFLMNEICIRFKKNRSSFHLVLNYSNQSPYLYSKAGSGPKASTMATQTQFTLSLQKFLVNQVIETISSIPGDRIIKIEFTSNLTLIIELFPHSPQIYLFQETHLATSTHGKTAALSDFKPKDSNPIQIRAEWKNDINQAYSEQIEKIIFDNAFIERKSHLEKELKKRLKKQNRTLEKLKAVQKEQENRPNYRHYGELLKTHLHSLADPLKSETELFDYQANEKIKFQTKEGIFAKDQMELFFALEKKSKRTISETEEQLEIVETAVNRVEEIFEKLKKIETLSDLTDFEENLKPSKSKTSVRKKRKSWSGKTFQSIDGYEIWVGKNQSENHELVFKFAKGSDVWLHLKNQPSAHVLILSEAGQSIPLETLLDAATLLLHFSGGNTWGKTEIIYTPRKNLRSIKGSKEVSFSNAKTLLTDSDPKRLDRLVKKRSFS